MRIPRASRVLSDTQHAMVMRDMGPPRVRRMRGPIGGVRCRKDGGETTETYLAGVRRENPPPTLDSIMTTFFAALLSLSALTTPTAEAGVYCDIGVGVTVACCANGCGEWGMGCDGGGSANYEAPDGIVGETCQTVSVANDFSAVEDGDEDAFIDLYDESVSYYDEADLTEDELVLLDEDVHPYTFEETRSSPPSRGDDLPTENISFIFATMR